MGEVQSLDDGSDVDDMWLMMCQQWASILGQWDIGHRVYSKKVEKEKGLYMV